MRRMWKIGLVILIAVIMTLGYGGWCKDDDDDVVASGSSGTPPAQVTLFNPSDEATDVPITQELTWSPPNGATSYDVYFGINVPPITLSFKTNTTGTSYDPPGNLDYDTTYYWRIDSKNSVGTTTGNVWSFTTTNIPDTTPPTITSVSPPNGATNVSISTNVSVTFSEAMNQTSAQNAFSISPGVSGSFSWSGNTMTFDPSSNLSYTQTYNCTVNTVAEDLAGNNMTSQYQWSFTTTNTPDTTPPTITSVSPPNGTTDVSISTNVSVTFSEGMNQTSAQNAFSISPSVSGSFSWSGNIMTFNPSSNLSYTQTYNCTVSTVAEDLAGNNMTSQYQWSFTTGSEPDTTPPTVSSVNPANSSTDVLVSTNISVTFSEAMNQTSAENAFSISPSKSGSFSWIGNTMTFNPSSNLAYSTPYICTVSTAAKDLAGNNMTSQSQWSFTTQLAQVTTPNPANAASDVSVTQQLSWASVSGATSYDVYFGTSSPGTFIGNQAGTTYDPGTLSLDTIYYWRIDSKNVGGTTTGIVWSFTTIPNYTFNYTGVAQPWVIPAGVTSIQVDVRGAQGQDVFVTGGKGARVRTTLSVTPGETLAMTVGGQGNDGNGGWPFGGNGGNVWCGGGGSASLINRGGTRLVIAGGGGGAGEDDPNGNGGNGGENGSNGANSSDGAGGGGGGTQSAVGAGGSGYAGGETNGSDGSGGIGGKGGVGVYSGGGGGGGYYGGGGGGSWGGSGAGGGGGSSYGPVTGTTYDDGYQSGNGQIIITW